MRSGSSRRVFVCPIQSNPIQSNCSISSRAVHLFVDQDQMKNRSNHKRNRYRIRKRSCRVLLADREARLLVVVERERRNCRAIKLLSSNCRVFVQKSWIGQTKVLWLVARVENTAVSRVSARQPSARGYSVCLVCCLFSSRSLLEPLSIR